MIGTFIFAFIFNTICALGMKSLFDDSDLHWLNTKLARIIFLIPPISIVGIFVFWIWIMVAVLIREVNEYLN
jgi:hypothetical protein